MRYLSLVLAAMLFVANQAFGQGRPIELGLDAGFQVSLTDAVDGFETDNVTAIQFPAQRFRIGFFVSDAVSIEPSVGFTYLSVSGESLTELGAGLAFVYHFTSDVSRPRVYLGAGGSLDLIDIGDASDAQFGAGALFGVKLPAGDQFAVRLEAQYVRAFESDDRLGSNIIGALVGFSFFTK
jgi:hypothetical protein